MRVSIRVMAGILVFILIACAGGGRSKSQGAFVSAGPVVMTDPLAGIYRGEGAFESPIAVFAPGGASAVVETACAGDVQLTIDRNAPTAVVGHGNCAYAEGDAPFAIRARFVDGNRFAGEVTFQFSGRSHRVPVRIAASEGRILAAFGGETEQGLGFTVRWKGEFEARRI